MEKFEWSAPEYIHTEKTTDWYWIVGIIAISIAMISIIFGNTIFGILVLVATVTLTLYATRKPIIIPLEVNQKGVKINGAEHLYSDLESFWIETRDAYPRIFFKLQKKLSLHIIVMLGNADGDLPTRAGKIREILSSHLEEKEHTEPLLEKILIYLGF